MTTEWLAALIVALLIKTVTAWLVWSLKKVREDMTVIQVRQHETDKELELAKQEIRNLSSTVKADIKEIKELLRSITQVTVKPNGK